MRVGIGYDCHRFAGGRPLVLGGVEIPHERGLSGHSDADVLSHAVIDAVLGAAGLDDIGRHFPDDDPRWRDASSLDLAGRVRALLEDRGLWLVNVDVTVVLERPKLAEYIAEMRTNLAAAFEVEPAMVSVKATGSEGMGFVGRGEGAAAIAVALVGRPAAFDPSGH